MLQQLGRVSRQAGGQLLTVLAICVSIALPVVEARDEPAPVVDAASGPGVSRSEGREMVERISRLERQLDSQTLVDMLTNMDRLRQEIQQLLSRMEEQTHSLDELQKRQRDLYLDIDQRLRVLEETQAEMAQAATTPLPVPATPATPPSVSPSPVSSTASKTTASAPVPADAAVTPPTATAESAAAAPVAASQATAPLQADPQLERKHYEMAFNLLKNGHYDQAVAAFRAFLETFPNGRFADNAQYWLGEASYVQGRFADALTEFDKVIKNFPASPKRADAMLKMGYTYQELGDQEQSTVLLNEVIKNFPDATAAKLAKKRLQDLKRIQ